MCEREREGKHIYVQSLDLEAQLLNSVLQLLIHSIVSYLCG